MSSRYAMVLVQEATKDAPEVCQLMQVYETIEGPYCSPAKLATISQLEEASDTVRGDGINTWFFFNGIFSYNHLQDNWRWVSKAPGILEQLQEPEKATYYSD